MAAYFARSGFARFGPKSPASRLFLGFSGSLGLYYASTFRKIHSDSNVHGPETRREYSGPQAPRHDNSELKPEKGIHRVDSVLWPANYPPEDVISAKYVKPRSWAFWSVYDGHVGPQTAWYLDQHLLPNLAASLSALYSDKKRPETETIHEAIKRVFLSLDDEIVVQTAQRIVEQPADAPIKALAAQLLQAARAGSCALVAFYDADVRRLHVSVVGDSRAILGRRRKTADGETTYDVHVLSVDQTGRNPDEVARLTAAHPGEELFERGRTLGWGITRSFGNGVMKWSRELQTFMKEKCLGDKPRTVVLTPPYFTAMPEITATAVEPGDFMVMGSDGLWDCLTNEEVVGLVGLWLQRNEGGRGIQSEEGVIERTDLPVKLTDDQTHYATWNVKKRFVNVDSNVARHLARNALGGADEDLHLALLTTPAPRVRNFRDDLSAIVVFFE